MDNTRVGQINSKVVELLKLNISAGTPIYIGKTNIEHIKSKHIFDFKRYGHLIDEIIKSPDYVGYRTDGSIEYIKKVKIDKSYVKVAVRVSAQGKCFVRTLYKINNAKIEKYISKGTLIKYCVSAKTVYNVSKE